MTQNASTATATNSTRQRVSHRRLRPPCPCLLALCLPLRCPLSLSSSLHSSSRSPRLKPVADVTQFAHPRWPTPHKHAPQYLSPRHVYQARHLARVATRSSLETTHFVGHAYRIWLYFPLLNHYVSFISLSVIDPSPSLASSLYVSLDPDIERYRSFRLCARCRASTLYSHPAFSLNTERFVYDTARSVAGETRSLVFPSTFSLLLIPSA